MAVDFAALEEQGFVQRRSEMNSPVEAKIAVFASNWRKRTNDVNIVLLDGSVSTDMDYASERTDQPYRPPMCTELNLPSYIEEKLRWKGQQYRRFDANGEPNQTNNPVFTESGGAAITKIADAAWDWQLLTPEANYNGITRVITGANPQVSYLFRSSYRRCDFLYRTDYLSSASLRVTIAVGNGQVTVFDETSGTWVEANGYTFSAKEEDYIFPVPAGTFKTATGYRKTVFQKRLKMRRTEVVPSWQITIRSQDGGRLGYWGIQYAGHDNMINFINSARGSHNIAALRYFEGWSVDDWKPDLILYACNTINEMISLAGGTSETDTPATFAGRFNTFITALKAKSYAPEIFAYMLFVNRFQQPVDPTDRVLLRRTSATVGLNGYTLFDYYDYLHATLKSLPIAAVNTFYEFFNYGVLRAAASAGTSTIFKELFGYASASGSDPIAGKTGKEGTSLVCDGTHLNDVGNFVGWRFLEKYFNL